MTDKPHTDALDAIEKALARCELKRWGDVPDRVAIAQWAAEIHEELTRCDLLVSDDDPRHIIEFRPDGWTIKHPLSCRLGDLFGCPVNLAAEDLDGPPVLPGRYAVTVDGIDGRLRIGDRVDQDAADQ